MVERATGKEASKIFERPVRQLTHKAAVIRSMPTREGKPMHAHNEYMTGISAKDRKLLDADADACRLEEIRDWLHLLRSSHRGGYHLVDANVAVVIDYTAFLLRKLDEKRGGA